MTETIDQTLRAAPLGRWACSNGCKHLLRADVAGHEQYRCAALDNFELPLAFTHLSGAVAQAARVSTVLTGKKIRGPHTEAPGRVCAHFEGDGDV